MKKILIAAMVVSAGAVAVQSSAAPKADDAIKQVFVQLDSCLANNDAKCVGDLFVEDGTYAWPAGGAKITKGKAQIVKTLEELMGTPAPNRKGAKQTASVENVRMIGEDHAVVDSSIAVSGVKSPERQAANAPQASYHAVAVMAVKGDKWLFEDLRSYVVTPLPPPEKMSASPATKSK
jgi:uncharacterized protein (TIGR02246 family)